MLCCASVALVGDVVFSGNVTLTGKITLPGGVVLTWDENDPSDEVTGYYLYYGTGSSNYNTMTNYVGLSRSVVASGLLPGTNYFFAVTATNVFGESDYSNEVSLW